MRQVTPFGHCYVIVPAPCTGYFRTMAAPLSSRRGSEGRSAIPGFSDAAAHKAGQWQDDISSGRRVLRGMRVVRRGVIAVLWTLLSCVVQAVLLALPGRAKVSFARLYWSVFTWLIGVRVRVVGAPMANGQGRRVIYASNHCSWLDIPVLGGRLEACFVSKDEIATWPGVSLVARLGRTVFVTRTRGATGRERDDMRARLEHGDDLLLFPEGTSSDGSRVLPFRSAFFSIAEGPQPPLIQPISVVYDRLGGLPTRRSTRSFFAWYGDMNLTDHFWHLAQWRGMRVTILVHPPLDPRDFLNRKVLAQATWDAVAAGAAAMRQNREDQALLLVHPSLPAQAAA
ncbi:1-acyl-sn-glycerol-3-phosphate acyltransferase [Acidisphaera sp. L21]|uniref:lysophospholipid acyltransferase family protein n=1 Tax=Acidisphaera sp. L21 TaxID=1641851 RepID=UPI0020B15A6C|nr:lysophospholipid acyltransferase family protein [Acidisphaera sp. L21]